jgi:hypothetical protein
MSHKYNLNRPVTFNDNQQDADFSINSENVADIFKVEASEDKVIIKDLRLNTGTNVNEFSTDGTLAGNSDSAVPTEQAVKTYVDNSSTSPAGSDGDLQINDSGSFGTIDGINLDKTGNTRGTNALDIQSYRTSATQVASGSNNFCIGLRNTAGNYNSGCVGYNNTVGGYYGNAVAVGSSNTASGYNGCTSVGSNNNNTANSGICVGASNSASYYGTTALGRGNTASGGYASAAGAGNTASAYGAVAFGRNCNVSGYFASAFGNSLVTSVNQCTELGPNNSNKIRVSSSGLDLSISNLPIRPASLADSSAPANSIYYSTTQSKLVYKDGSSVVHNLY